MRAIVVLPAVAVGLTAASLSFAGSASASCLQGERYYNEEQGVHYACLDGNTYEPIGDARGSVPVPQAPPISNSIAGEGIYVVGRDIAPGVYVSPANSDCYWERLSGLSGDFNDIITNGSGGGQQYIRVLPTDVAFSTSNCNTWSRVG